MPTRVGSAADAPSIFYYELEEYALLTCCNASMWFRPTRFHIYCNAFSTFDVLGFMMGFLVNCEISCGAIFWYTAWRGETLGASVIYDC